MTATGIKSYSSTPASNNASVPNGFPEGMAPSGVNDAARQVMAEIRRWYEDMLWLDFGYTYTYVSTTSFKVSGIDVTAQYPVNRRIRAIGSSTGTIYGVIATSVFSSDTTITITWDSGTLSSETLAVSVGPAFTGAPIPSSAISGISVTDATISTSDITTNNVTSTKHGFAPKSPALATQFLNGAATPAFAQVKDSDLAFTDVTTNNVTTSAHGYAPKAPNDATKYLDGTGAYSKPSSITLGTPVATTSGTTINLSNIGAGATVFYVSLVGVTTSGTSHVQVQVGPSGGVVNSGYLGGSSAIASSTATASSFTSGAVINGGTESSSSVRHGTITFTLENSSTNKWTWTGVFGYSNTNEVVQTAGSITLSGTVNKVSVTTINGTDTFSAGEINVSYQ